MLTLGSESSPCFTENDRCDLDAKLLPSFRCSISELDLFGTIVFGNLESTKKNATEESRDSERLQLDQSFTSANCLIQIREVLSNQ